MSERPLHHYKEAIPHFIRPMLLEKAKAPFDKPGWRFELKYDGYRGIAEVVDGNVQFYSREHNSFNTRFPSIVQALRTIPHAVLLDGEVVRVDSEGRPMFWDLQRRYPSTALAYFVFDLLHVNGYSTRTLSLRERQELLTDILPPLPNVKIVQHVEEKGVALFELVRDQGLEGIVAKKADSRYVFARRTRNWLKIKNPAYGPGVENS